jgi:dinuclear metal center YbgI/SA1388 family protein
MATLADVAAFLDETLNIAGIPDYPGAVNGVQVAHRGTIQRVAAAVDFSSTTVRGAVDAGAQLLLVHHGMFWGAAQAITSHKYERLRLLFDNDIAVYSAHLPLDIHTRIGNNALLARLLGLEPTGGFARFQNIDVGLSGTSNVPTSTIAEKAAGLARANGGHLVATSFGPDRMTRAWGICTGSGADSGTLREAASKGLDTLIVGEGPHHTAIEATELGIVVLYAGHYATETLGVRALADLLALQFGLVSTFVEAPSGL